MIKEKRKKIRRALRYKAWIGLGEGALLSGCMVSDISETGARLDVEDPEALPEIFNLLLSGQSGLYRRCRVMWRAENEIGVRFEKIGTVQRESVSKTAQPADA